MVAIPSTVRGNRVTAEDPQSPEAGFGPVARFADPVTTPKKRRDRQIDIVPDEPLLAPVYDGSSPPEGSDRAEETRERAAETAAEDWESLAAAAIDELDDQLRYEGIRNVGLYRQPEAVRILLEAAEFDLVSDHRLKAYRSLWYAAADGLDADDTIWNALRWAVEDPDDRITELAERAMADLMALEDRKSQMEFH